MFAEDAAGEGVDLGAGACGVDAQFVQLGLGLGHLGALDAQVVQGLGQGGRGLAGGHPGRRRQLVHLALRLAELRQRVLIPDPRVELRAGLRADGAAEDEVVPRAQAMVQGRGAGETAEAVAGGRGGGAGLLRPGRGSGRLGLRRGYGRRGGRVVGGLHGGRDAGRGLVPRLRRAARVGDQVEDAVVGGAACAAGARAVQVREGGHAGGAVGGGAVAGGRDRLAVAGVQQAHRHVVFVDDGLRRRLGRGPRACDRRLVGLEVRGLQPHRVVGADRRRYVARGLGQVTGRRHGARDERNVALCPHARRPDRFRAAVHAGHLRAAGHVLRTRQVVRQVLRGRRHGRAGRGGRQVVGGDRARGRVTDAEADAVPVEGGHRDVAVGQRGQLGEGHVLQGLAVPDRAAGHGVAVADAVHEGVLERGLGNVDSGALRHMAEHAGRTVGVLEQVDGGVAGQQQVAVHADVAGREVRLLDELGGAGVVHVRDAQAVVERGRARQVEVGGGDQAGLVDVGAGVREGAAGDGDALRRGHAGVRHGDPVRHRDPVRHVSADVRDVPQALDSQAAQVAGDVEVQSAVSERSDAVGHQVADTVEGERPQAAGPEGVQAVQVEPADVVRDEGARELGEPARRHGGDVHPGEGDAAEAAGDEVQGRQVHEAAGHEVHAVAADGPERRQRAEVPGVDALGQRRVRTSRVGQQLLQVRLRDAQYALAEGEPGGAAEAQHAHLGEVQRHDGGDARPAEALEGDLRVGAELVPVAVEVLGDRRPVLDDGARQRLPAALGEVAEALHAVDDVEGGRRVDAEHDRRHHDLRHVVQRGEVADLLDDVLAGARDALDAALEDAAQALEDGADRQRLGGGEEHAEEGEAELQAARLALAEVDDGLDQQNRVHAPGEDRQHAAGEDGDDRQDDGQPLEGFPEHVAVADRLDHQRPGGGQRLVQGARRGTEGGLRVVGPVLVGLELRVVLVQPLGGGQGRVGVGLRVGDGGGVLAQRRLGLVEGVGDMADEVVQVVVDHVAQLVGGLADEALAVTGGLLERLEAVVDGARVRGEVAHRVGDGGDGGGVARGRVAVEAEGPPVTGTRSQASSLRAADRSTGVTTGAFRASGSWDTTPTFTYGRSDRFTV